MIDLTGESGESLDVNRAISASLQDQQGILGGQVTREEQDISRWAVWFLPFYIRLNMLGWTQGVCLCLYACVSVTALQPKRLGRF